MRNRVLMAVMAMAAVGCSDPAGPLENLPVYPGWFLSTVNGAPLPIAEGNGGSLLGVGLAFRDYTVTGPGQGSGVVIYSRHVLQGGLTEPTIAELDFTIRADTLRINLCPRLALCVAVVDAGLVGPVAGATAPVDPHRIPGRPGGDGAAVPRGASGVTADRDHLTSPAALSIPHGH